MRAADIKIRDPFILPVAAEKMYYLFGTTDAIPWGDHPGTGFDTYRSRDLITWEGPFPAFRPPPGFWGTQHFWAPEVHAWRGRYYMFASFKSPTVHRGTQILVADHPLGPFHPHSPLPVTPADCECLDGTLHIEADGRPWMIFSRDWPQVTIGRYSAVPLREDFTAADGPAIELFPVNAAPWVIAPPWQTEQRAKEGLPPCFVADGTWPFRMQDGELCLLFSSWTANGYATGRPLGFRHPRRPLALRPRAALRQGWRPRHDVPRLRWPDLFHAPPAQRSPTRAPAHLPHRRIRRPPAPPAGARLARPRSTDLRRRHRRNSELPAPHQPHPQRQRRAQ